MFFSEKGLLHPSWSGRSIMKKTTDSPCCGRFVTYSKLSEVSWALKLGTMQGKHTGATFVKRPMWKGTQDFYGSLSHASETQYLANLGVQNVFPVTRLTSIIKQIPNSEARLNGDTSNLPCNAGCLPHHITQLPCITKVCHIARQNAKT